MKTTAVLLVSFCAPLAAQAVYVVPNGQPLDSYIAQANAGDILQLGSSHPSFHLDKGLIVRGISTGSQINDIYGGSVTLAIPQGQRARLFDLRVRSYSDGYSEYEANVNLQSGEAAISDANIEGNLTVDGGSLVAQRLHLTDGRVWVAGGVLSLADSSVFGANAYDDGIFYQSATLAMSQSGGVAVVSHTTLRGGAGSDFDGSARRGLLATGGRCYLTDCEVEGGTYYSQFDNYSKPAIDGGGFVEIARTAVVDPVGLPVPSSGYVVEPTMVGMRATAAPAVGSSFDVIATAGTQQELLVVVGGFTATANDLSPLLPETVFGDLAGLITVRIALPVANGDVVETVALPNDPALQGNEVWLQAIQFAGAQLRASALVGGVVR